MCVTCGCSDNSKATVTDLESGKVVAVAHNHDPSHEHDHDQLHSASKSFLARISASRLIVVPCNPACVCAEECSWR
jgi:hypothetical protein